MTSARDASLIQDRGFLLGLQLRAEVATAQVTSAVQMTKHMPLQRAVELVLEDGWLQSKLEQAESERLRCAALQDSLKAALTSSKQVPVLGKPRSKQFLAAALEHCQEWLQHLDATISNLKDVMSGPRSEFLSFFRSHTAQQQHTQHLSTLAAASQALQHHQQQQQHQGQQGHGKGQGQGQTSKGQGDGRKLPSMQQQAPGSPVRPTAAQADCATNSLQRSHSSPAPSPHQHSPSPSSVRKAGTPVKGGTPGWGGGQEGSSHEAGGSGTSRPPQPQLLPAPAWLSIAPIAQQQVLQAQAPPNSGLSNGAASHASGAAAAAAAAGLASGLASCPAPGVAARPPVAHFVGEVPRHVMRVLKVPEVPPSLFDSLDGLLNPPTPGAQAWAAAGSGLGATPGSAGPSRGAGHHIHAPEEPQAAAAAASPLQQAQQAQGALMAAQAAVCWAGAPLLTDPDTRVVYRVACHQSLEQLLAVAADGDVVLLRAGRYCLSGMGGGSSAGGSDDDEGPGGEGSGGPRAWGGAPGLSRGGGGGAGFPAPPLPLGRKPPGRSGSGTPGSPAAGREGGQRGTEDGADEEGGSEGGEGESAYDTAGGGAHGRMLAGGPVLLGPLRQSLRIIGLGRRRQEVVLYNGTEDDQLLEAAPAPGAPGLVLENLTLAQLGGYEGVVQVHSGRVSAVDCALQCSMSGVWVRRGAALELTGCRLTGSASSALQVEPGAHVELHDCELCSSGAGDDIVPKDLGGIEVHVKGSPYPPFALPPPPSPAAAAWAGQGPSGQGSALTPPVPPSPFAPASGRPVGPLQLQLQDSQQQLFLKQVLAAPGRMRMVLNADDLQHLVTQGCLVGLLRWWQGQQPAGPPAPGIGSVLPLLPAGKGISKQGQGSQKQGGQAGAEGSAAAGAGGGHANGGPPHAEHQAASAQGSAEMPGGEADWEAAVASALCAPDTPPAVVVVGPGCKVHSCKGFGVSMVKGKAVAALHEATQGAGSVWSALEGAAVFVAPGAQLAGNTRGPLGVVEAEYVDMEGDEAAASGARALGRFFHAVQLPARTLREGFASKGVDWGKVRAGLARRAADGVGRPSGLRLLLQPRGRSAGQSQSRAGAGRAGGSWAQGRAGEAASEEDEDDDEWESESGGGREGEESGSEAEGSQGSGEWGSSEKGADAMGAVERQEAETNVANGGGCSKGSSRSSGSGASAEQMLRAGAAGGSGDNQVAQQSFGQALEGSSHAPGLAADSSAAHTPQRMASLCLDEGTQGGAGGVASQQAADASVAAGAEGEQPQWLGSRSVASSVSGGTPGGSSSGKGAAKRCWGCGIRNGSLKLCSACKRACYCGPSCQQADWRQHRAECTEWAAMRRATSGPTPSAAATDTQPPASPAAPQPFE